MPNIDFAKLKTRQAWADALESILKEAEVAVKNNDSPKRLELQALLTTFIQRSPAVFDSLDEIARKTGRDLFESQVDASLKALGERDAELKQAMGVIKNVTAEAKKDADKIQFKNIIGALDKAKAALETLKELQASLVNPDQSLLDKIAALTHAINDLQDSIKPPEE